MGSPLMPPVPPAMSGPVPSMPAPAPMAPPAGLTMTPDEKKEWDDRLTKAREVRKKVAEWWDANLDQYAPDANVTPEQYGATLNTNRDFTLVERKKADLFYNRPDVIAIPSPLMKGSEAILDTHTTILNHALGPYGVDAKSLVHKALFDVLCPSGTGWTVMGYESTTIDTPTTDPLTGQPTTAPVPVYEGCFWRWLSPKQGLIPHDHKTTLWDDAPWLGYDFELSVRVAKRRGWVDDAYTGDAPDPELHFDTGTEATSAGDAVCKGTIIFCKSSLYRDDIVHPGHYTQIVFIEGQEQPAVYKDCPYQTLDPQGKLTPDSLLGNPIHPLTIRTLTDSAYVPSDCTISRPQVNELNRFRGQMVQQRDANLMRFMYNTDTLPTDALQKAVRAPIGGMIGLPGDAFNGEGAIKEFPHGTYPRENFEFQSIIDNDLARTHALDANQSGADNAHEKTATESQIQQSNVSARLGFERGVVLDWYVKGVQKYSTLIQRFYAVDQAAAIVGPQAAGQWDPWRKQVPSSLAFTASPDSTLRTDLASDRQRKMQEYTFLANDPLIQRQELLKHLVIYLGYPQTVVNPQPPQKQPEPIRLSMAIASADLNPMLPQYANLYAILTAQGMQGLAPPIQGAIFNQPPPPSAPGQTEHGGKVPQMEGLSKHAADKTGGMQGTGETAPMGTGGRTM